MKKRPEREGNIWRKDFYVSDLPGGKILDIVISRRRGNYKGWPASIKSKFTADQRGGPSKL